MFGKTMMICTPMALGGLYATGNLGSLSGQPFDVAPQVAYERIAYMPMPPQITSAGLNATAERDPGRSVKWSFAKRGSEVMNVTATLSPLAGGKATSLETEVDIQEDHPYAKQFGVTNLEMHANVSLAEQIASRIEGRPFDTARAQQLATAYVSVNVGKMHQDISGQLHETKKRFDQHDREAAYVTARAQAGKPTVTFDRD